MYQKIKKLADAAIKLQNKDVMDSTLWEISAICEDQLTDDELLELCPQKFTEKDLMAVMPDFPFKPKKKGGKK